MRHYYVYATHVRTGEPVQIRRYTRKSSALKQVRFMELGGYQTVQMTDKIDWIPYAIQVSNHRIGF